MFNHLELFFIQIQLWKWNVLKLSYRGGGLLVAPLCCARSSLVPAPWPPSLARSLACTHRLLDSSSWTHLQKPLVSCNEFVSSSNSLEIRRDSQEKRRKKSRIPLLKLVFRRNIISLLRVCHFILQLFVHASLKIS